MKRNDVKLIVVLAIVALISVVAVQLLQRSQTYDDGIAVVTHGSQEVLRIDLQDGSAVIIVEEEVISVDEEAGRYVVKGSYGDNNTVTIGYDPDNHTVRVLDEVSPQNICQKQGETNSPLKPLTCLPNEVVIRIETPLPSPEDDDAIIY